MANKSMPEVNEVQKVLHKLGVSSNLLDILVNVLVILKLQQLNIDLLWDACSSSGKPPGDEVIHTRESNRRLAESMEAMVNAMMSTGNTGN